MNQYRPRTILSKRHPNQILNLPEPSPSSYITRTRYSSELAYSISKVSDYGKPLIVLNYVIFKGLGVGLPFCYQEIVSKELKLDGVDHAWFIFNLHTESSFLFCTITHIINYTWA